MVRLLEQAVSGFALTALMTLATMGPATAQNGAWTEEDEAGVVATALDYMEGALNADAERVGRGVHEQLTKVIVTTLPQTGTQMLNYSGYTMLVEVVRGLGDRVADVDKSVEVTVFDIDHDIAVARAIGQPWYDYLQLAKIDGRWRIINVLWARNQPDSDGEADPETLKADKLAVEKTALDYIEGAYSGDAERMERALHPELTKVMLTRHRQTGEAFLYTIGASSLVEGTRAGLGSLEEGQRNIEVDIFDASHGMAAVKIKSAMYIDYLQIGKVNGEWKIINVLWVPNPDAPPPTE
jgi:hypothetical protein